MPGLWFLFAAMSFMSRWSYIEHERSAGPAADFQGRGMNAARRPALALVAEAGATQAATSSGCVPVTYVQFAAEELP